MSGASATVTVYALAAVALVGVAIHAFFAHAHPIRRVVALNVLASAVFLLLVAIARRGAEGPPDPVPHAMVLTGIVVAVSTTAFALVVLRRLYDATGRARPPEGDDDAD